MFTHRGDARTYAHNLKIASLLSFVAGSVNAIGFVSIQRLTTNVTGHFAFFADDLLHLKWYAGFIFFLYILFFFLGAFCSNTLIELRDRRRDANVFILPVAVEIFLLTLVALIGSRFHLGYPTAIACTLLFAMGLQNALVTKISNAVVRTTHLTGLFTDLGIEVSQLFFYREQEQRRKLGSNINLRLRIILFFFIGGVIGGFLYTRIGFHALCLPALLLLGGLFYDNIKFRVLRWAVRGD
jgi:uncharacterized membrane protein YoaK (UPF0700 family)